LETRGGTRGRGGKDPAKDPRKFGIRKQGKKRERSVLDAQAEQKRKKRAAEKKAEYRVCLKGPGHS